MDRMLSFLVLGFLLRICLAQNNNPSCFFPNGSPDPTGVPCDTSAEDSHCCSSRGMCLSNGLCFLQTPLYSNRISRQSCTDRSWKSESCPQYCADTYDGQGTTIWLGPENANGAFCCGQPYNVSSEECILGTQGSKQPFNLPAGYVYFDREGRNSTDPAAFGVTSSVSASGTGTPTNTAALVAATTASGDDDSGSCNTTAVGAGVGVPLGVSLLLAVGLLIWQWRKSSALQRQLRELHEHRGSVERDVSQLYQDQPNSGWGSTSKASAAPAYLDARKSEAPGDEMRAGELPATQQVIPELGSG